MADLALFKDERGKWSMARVGVCSWSLNLIAMMWAHPAMSPEMLAVCATIEMAFVTWAAGTRMAQYLAPGIAVMGQALVSAVQRRRDPVQGIEPTS